VSEPHIQACEASTQLIFVTLHLQMMVALVRDSVTAQGFGGLIISFTSMFSGVLIRPNKIPK
jgi:hypothetical protein